jgi:hypothetical protein
MRDRAITPWQKHCRSVVVISELFSVSMNDRSFCIASQRRVQYHFRVCVNFLKCLISVISVSRHVIAVFFSLFFASRSNTWVCGVYLLSAEACYSQWRGSKHSGLPAILCSGPSWTCHSSFTLCPLVSRQSQIIIWKLYSTFCLVVATR